MLNNTNFQLFIKYTGLLLCIFLLNSCTYYQVVSLIPSQIDTWDNARMDEEKEISHIIRIVRDEINYEVVDVFYEGEMLKGSLKKVPAYSFPSKMNFRKKFIEKNERVKFLVTLFAHTDIPVSEGPIAISLKDINRLRRYRINGVASTAATVATVIGLTFVGGVAILAIACSNCPKAYEIDQSGEKHFQGALFTGAISKTRERIDLLPLAQIDRSKAGIKLIVANEYSEEEYINQLTLLKTTKSPGYEVAHDISSKLFEFRGLQLPKQAISTDGSNHVEALMNRDKRVYGFSDEKSKEELNSIQITFDKTALVPGPVKLLVQARQTEWMQQVAGSYFSLYGTDYDKVIRKMDKIPKRFYNKYNASRGVFLNVFVQTKNGWDKVGSFDHVGIFKQKLLGVNIDLSKVHGNEVHIKLEAAFKFWEIDQVGLTQDFKMIEAYEEVPMISATNERKENVQQLLEKIDDQYALQPGPGTQITLNFAHTAKENEMYVLKGSGYYYENRDYTHAPQKEALRALRKEGKLGADELSRALHIHFLALKTAH